MSLKTELDGDLTDTFFLEDEHGCVREFRIAEDGADKVFMTPCCWDDQTLKDRVIVQQQGVYVGSVLLFIATKHFREAPKPEEILHSRKVDPVTGLGIGIFEGWRVMDISDAESCFELYLDKLIA